MEQQFKEHLENDFEKEYEPEDWKFLDQAMSYEERKTSSNFAPGDNVNNYE